MQRYKLIAAGGLIVGLGAVGFAVPVPESPEFVSAAADAPGSAAVETAAAGTAPATPPVTLASASEPGSASDALAAAASAAGAAVGTAEAEPVREPALETLTGSASYYADRFEGRTTASGVPFRQSRMWAAHKTLPFGTRLRVTNLGNGNEVEVEVVDRGPYAHGRVLDLSRTAAKRLDFIRSGHAKVKIEVLEKP